MKQLLTLRKFSSYLNHFLLFTFEATFTTLRFLSNFLTYLLQQEFPDKPLGPEKFNTSQRVGTENELTLTDEK
jgi:hypothetical protein